MLGIMKCIFGERLTELMQEANIDAQNMAVILGVTPQTINNWKSNRTDIWLTHLIALCSYFNCSLDYLVGTTEKDAKPNRINIENFGYVFVML